MSYDIESKSRNADFILIAHSDTTTLGAKGPVKLKNLSLLTPLSPLNLKKPAKAGFFHLQHIFFPQDEGGHHGDEDAYEDDFRKS